MARFILIITLYTEVTAILVLVIYIEREDVVH